LIARRKQFVSPKCSGSTPKTSRPKTRRAPAAALERAGVRAVRIAVPERRHDRAFLAGNDYRVTYAPYDWTLNEQPH
jgi:hypothetical protein